MKNKIRVLGVCGGNGVILYPFLSPKYDLLANVEPRGIFSTPNQVQWKLNFGKIPFTRDLSDSYKDVDLIIGAPDCGHSSILSYSRSKEMKDPRENKSLTMFLESILKYSPKIFAMENLTAMLKTYTEKDLSNLLKNYRLSFISTPVSYFGNSQIHRKRLIIVGIRKDLPKKLLRFYKVPEELPKLKVCGELINDLLSQYPNTKLCHVREDNNTVITLYAGQKMKVRAITKLWIEKHPFEKRLPVEGRNFTSAPGVYRNLEDHYPATARKQNRQFNHYGQMMSPRELARIQGLPDTFHLAFNETNPQYWINKGRTTVAKCPPFELADWINKKTLKAFKYLEKHEN
jgi:site-specific DNA-cytosine methylase